MALSGLLVFEFVFVFVVDDCDNGDILPASATTGRTGGADIGVVVVVLCACVSWSAIEVEDNGINMDAIVRLRKKKERRNRKGACMSKKRQQAEERGERRKGGGTGVV